MSQRRLILRGALAEKKERKNKLMMDIQDLITSVNIFSAIANTRKIEELDTGALLNTADKLDKAAAEYKEVIAEIKKIEDEIG